MTDTPQVLLAHHLKALNSPLTKSAVDASGLV